MRQPKASSQRSVISFLLALTVCGAICVSARGQSNPQPLTDGETRTLNISGGEKQFFPIALNSGAYVRVVVEQQGVDVAVALIGPDQERLIEMDSPNGNYGPEPITAIAERTGSYVIEVRSPDPKAPVGQFTLRVEAVREPTAEDRRRAAAEQSFVEASRMLAQPASRTSGVEKLEAILPVFQSLHDEPVQISILNRLGLADTALGQPRSAVLRYEQALTISRALADERNQARMLNNLGGAYDILGEPQRALQDYQRSLALWETLNNDLARGDTLNNIGVIYYNLGELQVALDYYQRALPLRRAGSNWRREADTLDNLSLVYIALGDPQAALEQLGKALELRRTARDKQGEANTLNQIGFAYTALGDTARALEYYNQALPLRRTAGDRRGEAVTLKNIGAAFSSLEQPRKAIEQLDQALSITRDIHSRREEGIDLVYLGQAHLLAGDAERAAKFYGDAWLIFQELNDRLDEARALQGLAEVESARGNLTLSRERIEAAIGIIEALRGRVTNQQLRTSFFASRQDAYEFQIDLLMRMDSADPSKNYATAALEASERARARNLLDMLAESGVDVREGADPTLLQRERDLAQLLNTKASRLIVLLGQPDRKQQAAALKEEIGRLETEFQQVRGDIRQRSPHYAAITQPEPVDIGQMQRSLDPETMLLEYSLGADRSYLWAVTTTTVHGYRLPGRQPIDRMARRLYELVAARSVRKTETAAEKRQRVEQADALANEEAARLSQLILGPVAAELGNKRLAIVGDGALQYIPFSMLPIPRANPTANSASTPISRPLIMEHELVNLPSASALILQRKELAGRTAAPRRIALFADPVFDASDPRVKGAPGLSAKISAPADDPGATRTLEHIAETTANANERLRVRRLPFTREEADRIMAVVPDSADLRATDFKANLATISSGQLQEYRYVHFATHGYIDTEKPGLSALVLSLVNERGEPQDGLLKPQEIYNLRLRAELVVLSACQTGLGKEIRGEGVVGLTRGFMYAGAARLVVSMWNVSDRGTADLMSGFYRNMIARGLRPAAALRAAQIELSRQKQWNSPYYWAAFVQQGEWR